MTSPTLKLPPVLPPTLRPVQCYLRTASELERRDAATSYWCRLHALQTGLATDRSPGSLEVLMPLMDWLEAAKAAAGSEAVTNELVAQAHVEAAARKLFLWADSEDRAGRASKNVVKAFYTAGVLFDVCDGVFSGGGNVDEEMTKLRRYAKWKASYIHGCLKEGRPPVPGPAAAEEDGAAADIQLSAGLPQTLSEGLESGGGGSSGGGHDQTVHSPVVEPAAPDPSALFPSCSVPSTSTVDQVSSIASTSSGSAVSVDVIVRAQKYSKMAYSALNHEDISSAIDSLQKALTMLKTGQLL